MAASKVWVGVRVWFFVLVLVAGACSVVGSGDEDDVGANDDSNAIGSETDDGAGTETEAEEAEPVVEEPTVEEIVDIWHRADDAVFAPDDQTSVFEGLLAPSERNGTWTVVGALRDHTTSRNRAAVWEFDDLVSNAWTRTDVDPNSPDTDELMTDVVRFGDLRLAAGSRGTGPNQRGAIWVGHPDGSWDSAATTIGGDDVEWVSNFDVDEEADRVVALGGRSLTNGTEQTVFWTSEDGLSWTKVEPGQLEQDTRARPVSVAVGPEGIVAIGTAENEGLETFGRVWVSADGTSWSSIDPESMSDGYQIRVSSIDRLPDRYVVVGSLRPTANGIFVPASWTSSDGQDWEGPFVSFSRNDDGRHTTDGFGALHLASIGDEVLATASHNFMQHVWKSADGRVWEKVDNIWDIRDVGVGIIDLDSDGATIAAITDEPALLYNNTRWGEKALDKTAVPTPDQEPYTNKIIWSDEGFIAVGGYEATPTRLQFELEAGSWVSADGTSWEEYIPWTQEERGPINSVGLVNGEPIAVVTETLTHAIRNNRRGSGMLLRNADGNRWSQLYELKHVERRSGLSTIVQAGDTLIVGGWQFAANQTRTEARLGETAVADIGTSTEIDIESPAFSGGQSDYVTDLCVDDDGVALAIGGGDLDTQGHFVSVATRSTDGAWTKVDAVDSSFDGNESQNGVLCLNGPDGLVVGGWIFNDGDYNAALWQPTAEGQMQLLDNATFAGDGDQWIADGVTIGDRYLLVGTDERSGNPLATIWIGRGSEWSALPIGPESWSIRSPNISSDAAGLPEPAPDEATIVIGASQYGRSVVYHTTLAEIDEALTQLALLPQE